MTRATLAASAAAGLALGILGGFAFHGLLLGLAFGVLADLARRDAPDPPGWRPGYHDDAAYRAVAVLISVGAVVVALMLAGLPLAL